MERYRLSEELAAEILEESKKRGATAADVVMVESDSFNVTVRLGEIDKVSQAREKRLGLRLFHGASSATASTSDISKTAIEKLIDETLAMARATAPDELSGLPEPAELAREVADLDLADEKIRELTVDDKIKLARAAEASALNFDPRITNSEGSEFSSHEQRVIYGSSHGFTGQYRSTVFGLSVAPVASENGAMERDSWYSIERKFARLEPAQAVGEKAAQRTLRKLNARKVKTRAVPVVFDPETAASLLRHLASALSGYALYKRASFLLGRLGQPIGAEGLTVIDDATIPGALGSRPFDGEGLACRKNVVIERGVLRSYLLDTYSGKKLGLPSTANAARAVGSAPTVAPTNFFLLPGRHSPQEILESVDEGFYVTDLIGFGVNLVTGDYSRGASGLWIEKGRLSFPVEEVTIAGNLNDMLRDVEMVGSDLEMRNRTSAPTIKIARMTVAGD
ncbi:MAG TPA: TldD/PmbA family protein [Candidatus Acidoferrales bacterium]|nr:TldD/PmbA family protein [Candidatus Acidoferrales bacterium]